MATNTHLQFLQWPEPLHIDKIVVFSILFFHRINCCFNHISRLLRCSKKRRKNKAEIETTERKQNKNGKGVFVIWQINWIFELGKRSVVSFSGPHDVKPYNKLTAFFFLVRIALKDRQIKGFHHLFNSFKMCLCVHCFRAFFLRLNINKLGK